jgi:hypothetical protein
MHTLPLSLSVSPSLRPFFPFLTSGIAQLGQEEQAPFPSSSSSLLAVGCRREPGLDLVVHASVYGKIPFPPPHQLLNVVATACPTIPPLYSTNSLSWAGLGARMVVPSDLVGLVGRALMLNVV